MPILKNVAGQKLAVYAHDTAADAPETGDAANITARISLDGAAVAQTDDVNPTELDAAHAKGVYIFDLIQAETDADLIILSAVSATADVSIEPVMVYTDDARVGSRAMAGDQMALQDGAITAAKVAAGALDNKGNWNIGKTGYTLTAVNGLGNQTANITGDLSGSVGSVAGNVDGKVLGGGAGVIGGVGAWALDGAGNAIAPASTALTNATWTDARAGYVDKLNVAGTLAHSDAADTYKANVAALALEATAQAIKAKTDALPANPAAVGSEMNLADGALSVAKVNADLKTGDFLNAQVKAQDNIDFGALQKASLDAAIAATKAILDKVETTLEEDGALWRFTEAALVKGPSGEATVSDADKTDIAQRAWNNRYASTRTLTQSAAQVAAIVAGSTITVMRGDSWSISLTGLGSLATRSKLWFTAKRHHGDADTTSVIQIRLAGGLIYLNGAAGIAGDGSLTVDDEDKGNITIALAASSSKLLPPGSYDYDVQMLTTTGAVQTMTNGVLTIVGDYTRAVT